MQVLLTFLLFATFQTNLDSVFAFVRSHDWTNAATTLDQTVQEDPALFELNSLPYLRGRVAETQQDWQRSKLEFGRVSPGHPLRPLAAWHAAWAAVQLGQVDDAKALIAELPPDFSQDMKMDLAEIAPAEVAMILYQGVNTREARLRQALARNDSLTLWAVLHERNSDDVGLQAARALSLRDLSPKDSFEVAQALLVHRQFADAIRYFQNAVTDSQLKAEASFQIARAHFLGEDYDTALAEFNAITSDFAGTSWQKDAEYQAANCYWRMGDYKSAEKAYVDYIARYGGATREQGAVRNLIDVYRLLGDNTRALTWIDRGLAAKVSASTRQVLLFTKAKVLFVQKRYAPALTLFQQLGRTRLRSIPGGATKDEVQFHQAMALSKLGRTAAAKTIWTQLAANPLTYYGQKAAEQISKNVSLNGNPISSPCATTEDLVLPQAETVMAGLRRPVRMEGETFKSAVDELLFLQLWDEAFPLFDRQPRPDARTAASLAYLANRYDRAISYADRLPKNDPYVQRLRYPRGFQATICQMAAENNVDPLWLHAIVWQESKYNPLARSGASARGLMQFVPDTAETVAASLGIADFELGALYDPAVNIRLGARYWASLMSEFKQPELALAAYNGGPDNVRRWKGKWPEGDATFFVSDIGFIETKSYVMAVFGARAAYAAR